MPETFLSHSEDDTVRAAECLAARLERGAVVLLYGDLGAGKTAFVRGLASGLGIDPDEVSSPSFALIQEYRGRLTLYHVDLYRLEEREVEDLGLEELGAGEGILAIEWAEKLAQPPPSAVAVRISDRGGEERAIEISATENVER